MKFINEENFSYLSKGLTYSSIDISVLDAVLVQLNSTTGLIDSIVEGNNLHGFKHKVEIPENQLIFSLDKFLTADNNRLTTAHVLRLNEVKDLLPCVHLNLQSPTLNVPQRIEIPLKYILNGLPYLGGTHMVYLHAIEIDNGPTYSYYGKTKRGWMVRYIEHVKLAMKGSNRKFPMLFGDAIKARFDQLLDHDVSAVNSPIYTGSYHVVCAAGLNNSESHEVERYLIRKNGLNPVSGLNMI